MFRLLPLFWHFCLKIVWKLSGLLDPSKADVDRVRGNDNIENKVHFV